MVSALGTPIVGVTVQCSFFILAFELRLVPSPFPLRYLGVSGFAARLQDEKPALLTCNPPGPSMDKLGKSSICQRSSVLFYCRSALGLYSTKLNES